MEKNLAVLGDADFVMPFSALGADTYPVAEDTQVRENAARIIEGDYALIVVAENIAPAAEEVFSSQHKKAAPCILVVPFTTESKGFATEALGKVLKMATGINILKSDWQLKTQI